MKKIFKPHDKLFRNAISNPKVAKSILQQHLPKILQKHINFKTLSQCPEHYIDKDLEMIEVKE